MSELSNGDSDPEWTAIGDGDSGDEQAYQAEIEKSSKEVIKDVRKRFRAVQKEKLELKSYFAKQIPSQRTFFRGIQDEILLERTRAKNTLSCPNKTQFFSTEILQEIIKHCDIGDQVMLSLTSKQMALHVDKIQSISEKKGVTLRGPKTELRLLNLLLRLDEWMGARRLCFSCLKYKPVKQSIWSTRKQWEKTKWEGGSITKNKQRSEGPRCKLCAVKHHLQMPNVKKTVQRLKDGVLKL